MSWRQEITRLVGEVDMLNVRMANVSKSLVAVNAKLDLLTKTNQEQVTKLADRLVEMAMVQNGFSTPASVHRNAARMEQPPDPPGEGPDLWEDKWPPDGHVAINMP